MYSRIKLFEVIQDSRIYKISSHLTTFARNICARKFSRLTNFANMAEGEVTTRQKSEGEGEEKERILKSNLRNEIIILV